MHICKTFIQHIKNIWQLCICESDASWGNNVDLSCLRIKRDMFQFGNVCQDGCSCKFSSHFLAWSQWVAVMVLKAAEVLIDGMNCESSIWWELVQDVTSNQHKMLKWCGYCAGCNSSHIRTEGVMSFSPAGPHIASGNSLRPGRNPSIFPDTSSKRTIPKIHNRWICEIFQKHFYPSVKNKIIF